MFVPKMMIITGMCYSGIICSFLSVFRYFALEIICSVSVALPFLGVERLSRGHNSIVGKLTNCSRQRALIARTSSRRLHCRHFNNQTGNEVV